MDQSQSTNPLGQPNATAGPSRPPPSRSPFSANFGLPGNQNGMNNQQAMQARLAAAQQALMGMQNQQQQSAGSNNGGGDGNSNGARMSIPPNAASLLANMPNVNNEQVLRQEMQASHARQGGQRNSFGQQSVGTPTAPSPSNTLPQTPSAPSPSVNGGITNNSVAGPASTSLQQQKDLLTQHNRLANAPSGHNLSSGSPMLSTPTGGMTVKVPATPAQASAQRKQFFTSLQAYYRSNNLPLPPPIFNGERDGEVKVAGCWVDMFELFMAIMRAHGVANAIKQTPDSETWKKLFANSGLPHVLPQPIAIPIPQSHASANNSFPTVNPVQYLVGLYVAYIKGFEDQMQKHRMQMMQRQQAATTALGTGKTPVRPPAPGQIERSGSLTSATTPQATSGAVATPPAMASTPTATGAQVPSAPTTQASVSQSAPTPTNVATPIVQNVPTPTPLSASTPVTAHANLPTATPAPGGTPTSSSNHNAEPTSMDGMQNGQSGAINGTHVDIPQHGQSAPDVSGPTPSSAPDNYADTPSSAKRKLEDAARSADVMSGSPSTPKRARYKVEYKPIHVPMTHLAGWDERAVRSTFPKNNMAHPTHSIHELGVVDMEAILMGLRSRMPRELGYAITVLSMLSMPHPEDQLDGLPLIHIKDIYNELLYLLEEAVFGEDGYGIWEEKTAAREDKPRVDLSNIDFAEFEQLGRHEDIDLAEDISSAGRWRKSRTGGMTDIAISLVNLLRNFSLYDENQAFMGRNPATFAVLSRIIDSRLTRVPGWCSAADPYSLIEYHAVCRDVTMILTNIGRHVNLAAVVSSNILSVFRHISRVLSSGLDLSTFKDTPYGWDVDPKVLPIPIVVTLYRATEAFYNLAGSDQNREALGRVVPENELVALFDSLIKLLPNTTRAITALLSTEAILIHAECTALALYSLTFLSPLSARAMMRSIPGAAAILRRLITKLMQRHPSFGKSPFSVLCRRLSETLGVLNGTVTCTGESASITQMGFSAGSGDGKGWRWASGIVEGGWMADCGEIINECLMVPEVDKHTFAELDALWWAREE